MPDARCTRGLVSKCAQKVRPRAYRAAENIRHPLRSGFTAYSVLSPERLFCLRSALGNRTSPRSIDASTATSGPHAFAVRVLRNRHAHFASTASPPLVLTIANAPLSGTGWVFL